MSRPLRIAYPGAWYHVMNRGRRNEIVFSDRNDYRAFTDLLQESSESWNIRVAAYCMMPNHYHLLLQTPEANISRAMRHINGVYTQRFNRRHRCNGQLFRGRYKSILVGGDSYLLQLVRYIHRNPLKAGLVKDLNAYSWSSHRGYLSVATKWDWLYKDFILTALAPDKKQRLRAYRQFIATDEDNKLTGILNRNKWPSILGPQEFLDRIKITYREYLGKDETPQLKDLHVDLNCILMNVCKYYKVAREDLITSRRGVSNEPRSAAIYLIRKLRRDTLSEIGKVFHVQKYSTISTIIERFKLRMENDPELKHRIHQIENIMVMSQEQT